MPRPRSSIPKVCIDSSRNRAFCKVHGKFISLGPAGSREAQLAYAQVLAQLTHERGGESHPAEPESVRSFCSLNELFLRFMTERLPQYSTAEQHCLKGAIRLAAGAFGETPVSDFGPVRLRHVREAMVAEGWSRSYVNKQMKRLRLIFRWGISWELVPPRVLEALETLPALRANESPARESIPRLAVPTQDLNAVRGELNPRNRDIFNLLLLTGARPGEILSLTGGAIDQRGEVWRADLTEHKTRHMGKTRTLFFNSAAQEILQRYLTGSGEQRLFPIRRDSFGQAIKVACRRAGVVPFVPHQLRHTVATQLADEVGPEAAQRLLGHSTAAMTEHYSRGAEQAAVRAAQHLDPTATHPESATPVSRV